MGMAASQARLLALTSRMHDIELRAQNIEAQKLALATLEDQAYQKYCDAMDAKKIQVGVQNTETGKITYVDATFNNVCGYQASNKRQYMMVNNLTGKVMVSPEIKDLYEQYSGDKYTFAWAAMGYDGQYGWSGGGGPFGEPEMFMGSGGFEFIGIGTNTNYGTSGYLRPGTCIYEPNVPWQGKWPDENGQMPAIGNGNDLYMSEAEYLVFLMHYTEGSSDPLSRAYDALIASTDNGGSVSERRKLLNDFRDTLYNEYGQEILNAMNQDKNWPPEDPSMQPTQSIPDAFQDNTTWTGSISRQVSYYENLWEEIEKAGGCETVDEIYCSGEEGVEWFNSMVTSGLVTLYMLDTTKTKGWEVTTIATSVGDNYLQEVQDEEKAKKAEVEYEHETKIINRKDTKFDTELKKLETEENACKTEIDSIKKVKDDNIERTFNLFS